MNAVVDLIPNESDGYLKCAGGDQCGTQCRKKRENDSFQLVEW